MVGSYEAGMAEDIEVIVQIRAHWIDYLIFGWQDYNIIVTFLPYLSSLKAFLNSLPAPLQIHGFLSFSQ